MLGKLFSRSSLKNQACSYLKQVAKNGSCKEELLCAPMLAQGMSTATVQQKDTTPRINRGKGLKGHGLLAPFTDPKETAEQEPLLIDRTEGCYVFDGEGNKYLDGVSSVFCTSLGGSEPRLVAAAVNQLKTLPFYHAFWNCISPPPVDLAKELLETFTATKMKKVFFTNGGSESNESMVKIAWYYNNALGRPNKKRIISRKYSYHGSTIAAASLTRLYPLHEGFDLPGPFVLETECPHYWRNHLPGETEEQFATRLAKELEDLILKEGPDTIAAFICEPVHAAGGVIIPPNTYYEKIQAVLKKYDILLIVDEVVCGFGRIGAMFGCDKMKMKPDMVALAKGFSSGYMPIGAVLINPEITDVIETHANKLGGFGHGFTNSGHPVSCAVALEAVKIYKERNIGEAVEKISPRFLNGLRKYLDSPIIGEIRGIGLFACIEFVDNKSPNDLFPVEWGVADFFDAECKKRGLFPRTIGHMIILCPAVIITPGEIDELLRIFGEALKPTEERMKQLKLQHKKQ